MIFEPVAQPRTADAVTAQIEDLILDGVLRPGDRLPPERDLAQSLDVSRPVLREAMADLTARGLLSVRHGEGSFVADVIGEVFRQPVVDLIRRRPRLLADYLAFRRDIDGLAASLAAERAGTADIALLDRTVEALRLAHADADPARESALDVEFHAAIGEAAHNAVLLHTLRACYRMLSGGVFYNRDLLYGRADCRARLLDQHLAIHAAIRDRDPEAARRAAGAHIDYVSTAIATGAGEQERNRLAERRLAARGGNGVARA